MAQIHIFLSQSSADRDFADALARALRGAGADVWYDETHLGTGQLLDEISAQLPTRPRFPARPLQGSLCLRLGKAGVQMGLQPVSSRAESHHAAHCGAANRSERLECDALARRFSPRRGARRETLPATRGDRSYPAPAGCDSQVRRPRPLRPNRQRVWTTSLPAAWRFGDRGNMPRRWPPSSARPNSIPIRSELGTTSASRSTCGPLRTGASCL